MASGSYLRSWEADKIIGVYDARLTRRSAEAGDKVVAHIKGTLSSRASPSAPGEPPALVSGALRDSVHATVSKDGDRIRVRIAAAAPYALFLEFGTSRLAARPFMRPGVLAMKTQIKETLAAR